MLQATQGIVLTHYKYGESSLVVHIFTRELGMQNYMVNGVWRKNAKFKAALFQPFTLLDMHVYFKQNKSLQRIKEIELLQANHSILSDVHKTTIAFFIAEFLHKTLKIESADENIFNFLKNTIHLLENTQEQLSMFPISFLKAYSSILGIIPQPPQTKKQVYFDLMNGQFTEQIPMHPMSFNAEDTTLFSKSLLQDNETFSRNDRQKLTDLWFRYYQIHFETVSDLNSIHVLREIFA